MNKKVSKLGSYSNDGLSMGFESIEFSEDNLDEMRKIVAKDFKNIEIDLNKQLLRLDTYLKKEFGALFRNENFVKWFFDKKKITQWGKSLPKISEKVLFEYSRIYIQELNELSKRSFIKTEEKNWLFDESILTELAKQLKASSSIENDKAFIDLFLSGKKENINWLKNKTTLIYLISKLKLNKFIGENISENSFIEKNFRLKGNRIKNTKQSKEQMSATPRGHNEIDSFINAYKNPLP